MIQFCWVGNYFISPIHYKVLILSHRVLRLNDQNTVMAEESRQIFVLHSLRQFVLPGKAPGYEAVLVHPGSVLSSDQQPAFERLNDDILRAELHNVQQDPKASGVLLPAARRSLRRAARGTPAAARSARSGAWQRV